MESTTETFRKTALQLSKAVSLFSSTHDLRHLYLAQHLASDLETLDSTSREDRDGQQRCPRFSARDLQGSLVTGWYVELHKPVYDPCDPVKVIGYDTLPCLFNDEEGERSKGSYWHEITLGSLRKVNKPIQLSLF